MRPLPRTDNKFSACSFFDFLKDDEMLPPPTTFADFSPVESYHSGNDSTVFRRRLVGFASCHHAKGQDGGLQHFRSEVKVQISAISSQRRCSTTLKENLAAAFCSRYRCKRQEWRKPELQEKYKGFVSWSGGEDCQPILSPCAGSNTSAARHNSHHHRQ